MAPIAIATSLTSPPGPNAAKQAAANNKDQGLSLDVDGAATPYSATSTAVSENGDASSKKALGQSSPRSVVDEGLPSKSPTSDYFQALLDSSAPKPDTKAGTTVFGSAIAVLEALAVQRSHAVWVFDDAIQVGFGASVGEWTESGKARIYTAQTRPGAGLDLAGFLRHANGGKVSVFASTTTLPFLLPHLSEIDGDIIIHLATTEPDASLQLADALSSGGVIRTLCSVPEDWTVVFSTGSRIVPTAASLLQSRGKVIHVVESTYIGREATRWTFPGEATFEEISSNDASASNVSLALDCYSTTVTSGPLVTLHTLTPAGDALLALLAGKHVTVLGATRVDAEALKAAVLAALYSAPQGSTAALPSIHAGVYPVVSTVPVNGKIISFYTEPSSVLPRLVGDLFKSSPSLNTRLARFGSSTTRGVKSVLSLSAQSTPPLLHSTAADVAWVSDANVLKSTNILEGVKDGGILVLELPWSVAEVPIKLSAAEVRVIQEKHIRVFLLDVDVSSAAAIVEQVAFLVLYTGQQRLAPGIRNVLEAYHGGRVARDHVEAAYAGLDEIAQTTIASWEVDDEGSTKIKDDWVWDAMPDQQGLLAHDEGDEPMVDSWVVAARHLLFREAYAVDGAKTLDDSVGPAIAALRPSTADETFLVKVTENRRLTPVAYDRNVFHLELDTSGTGLKYEIGEAIGIHGWNDTQEVLDFCSDYNVNPDAVIEFVNPLQTGTQESRTVFQLLQQNVDLFGRPGKAFYAALAKLASSRAEAMTLKFISAPEGAELFKKMAEKETVTFADVLRRFRTARPSIADLVGLIPEIKPRHYSIASSQKAIGDKVELLIVTVDWINSKGSPRYGQCTRYLAALQPGAQVTVSIKPSVMKLPPDDRQPIIMAGLGTGAAPFRAFMQHRAWQRSQGIDVGPLVYYFGSRYRSQEYLYGEEIEAYIASGIISHAGLAFSRDGKDKMYIQHKMKQDKAMLARMLSSKGSDAAYFYLCGPTWPVPDVYEALVSSLTEEAGWERQKAESYIEELKEDERYVLEVY